MCVCVGLDGGGGGGGGGGGVKKESLKCHTKCLSHILKDLCITYVVLKLSELLSNLKDR